MAYLLRLEVPATTDLNDACQVAQAIADAAKRSVEFEFNGVDCVAVPGGCKMRLARRQGEAQNSRPRVTSSEGKD